MSIQVDSTMTVKKTVALAQVIPQYRETQGQGRRKLLTADEVLRLPHEEMLVIIRGQNLLKLKKFDYTKHPMSKELVPTTIQSYCPRQRYAMPQTDVASAPVSSAPKKNQRKKLSTTDVVQNKH